MALDLDCDGAYLPEAEANYCAPDVNFGQVGRVFFTTIGNPLTLVTDLVEFEARIANTDAVPGTPDLTSIRYVNTVGGKPAPNRPELTISRDRKVYPAAEHTVNITIDETSEVNYNLLKEIEENGGQFLIWYEAGKYIYGGNAGIQATLILDDIIPDSNEELNTFVGTIKWKGNHPDRALSPFA